MISAATPFYFQLDTFVNPRIRATTALWSFRTMDNTLALIGQGTATATITSTNNIIAILPKTFSYYNSNTEPVNILITLSNPLVLGDYLLLSIPNTAYTNTSSTITCTNTLDLTCTISDLSITTTLIIKTIPTTLLIGKTTFNIILSGLISSSTNTYTSLSTIFINSYDILNNPIDSGSFIYNISCGSTTLALINQCKQCYPDATCVNCYYYNGYYYYPTTQVCTLSCTTISSSTMYSSIASANCQPCINNCLKCRSDVLCITCVATYYLYINNSTCLPTCDTNNKLFTYIDINSQQVCVSCSNTACLQCVNISYNGCLKCTTITVL